MKSVVLGTAGHVDHGKTALIEALTGVNTDRWAEERERGITIDLGFTRYPQSKPNLDLSVVDVPGHEDFVKNMLAGATGIDLLLLVVAADEGPMPQTKEHLWIARLLGLRSGVVAITKADLVDDEWLELVSESVRTELEAIFGPNQWPLIPVSVITRQGLPDLDRAILHAASAGAARRSADLFRLPIDRAFTVKGTGTVVTGTIWSGRVESGDELRLLPADEKIRVRGLQVHGEEARVAGAGQRTALALAGLDRARVGRGDVLVADPVWRISSVLDVRLEVIPEASWKLRHWQRLRLYLGTSEAMARLVLYDRDALEPGASARVQLRLEKPILARAGDRFVIRFYSPVTTVGGGVVLDPWARRRGKAAATAAPMEWAAPTAAQRLEGVLSLCGSSGASEPELAILTGLSPDDITGSIKELEAESAAVRKVGGRWYVAAVLDGARTAIIEELARRHAADTHARGASLELLRSRLGLAPALANAALSDLQREGRVRVEGSLAALQEHRAHLSRQQQKLAERVQVLVREGGVTPPSIKEMVSTLGVTTSDLVPVLKFFEETGGVIAVTSDLYYDSGVMAELETQVRTFLAGGRTATPGDFRQLLGMSRKYLIPLLEHLDGGGVTRRTPEGRVLKEA